MNNQIFSSAHCLLLDKRFSEKARIKREFGQYGIDVKFFVVGEGTELDKEKYNHINVIPPTRSGYPAFCKRLNSYNAFLCFKEMIRRADFENRENLLLIEDDVVLTEHFGEVLEKAWGQLNRCDSNWEMLYLGANHTFKKTEQVYQNLLRVNGSGCFHCVLLRNSIFKEILSWNIENPIDSLAAQHIHPRRHCYAAWPNIAITKSGYSHCEGREVDYDHFWGNKGC